MDVDGCTLRSRKLSDLRHDAEAPPVDLGDLPQGHRARAFGAQLGLVAWLARRTRLAREGIEPGPSERRAVGRGRGSGISKVWAVDTAGLRAFTISAGTSRRL